MGAGVRSSCLQSKYPYPLSHLPSPVVMSLMVTTQVWQRHTKQIVIAMLMEKQSSLIGDSSGRSLNTNYPVHNVTWQKELCNNSPKDPQRLNLIGVASCGHKNKMNNSKCQALPLDASLAKGLKQADSVLINTYTHAERVKKCNLYNLTQLPVLQGTTEQSGTPRLVPC